MNGDVSWESKLLGWNIPPQLASRMAVDLGHLPNPPESYVSIFQAVSSLGDQVVAMDWWSDFWDWVNQTFQLAQQMVPGMILTAGGAAVLWALKGTKIKGIPLGLLGLIPVGLGMWMIMQPFMPQQ